LAKRRDAGNPVNKTIVGDGPGKKPLSERPVAAGAPADAKTGRAN
jgi:hypothetical protein|tara:strand:- start:501 stop:635 length:135 start_codon:yes stop_codon:yes gene_type:complete